MISYLFNSSMSGSQDLYICFFYWLFLSVFFIAEINSYVRKSNKKISWSKILVFRIIYGIILFCFFGPAMLFIDFFVIWLTGAIRPLSGAWAKLFSAPLSTIEEKTQESDVFFRCKKCNMLLSYLDRVCPKCGEHTENYDYIGQCKNCNTFVKEGEKFCSNCGLELTSIIRMKDIPDSSGSNNNAAVATNQVVSKNVIYANKADYNNEYSTKSEEQLLNDFIAKELTKYNMNDLKHQLPLSVYRKKMILNILFVILLFFFNVLIFFHFDIYIYIIYAIILIILFIKTRKFNLNKFYTKEIKSRPSEKISNIILSTKNDYVSDKSRFILIIGMILCILIPAFYFKEPRVFYEKSEDGYGYVVRFYTLGLTKNNKVVIPDTYNDEPVVGIRGNVFKNMFLLKEVVLPDTITEIRGSTFKNDISLLKIKLPSNLTRIGGNAFENCSNLTSINIPDKVTRIAGHAFQGCTNLSRVNISENSQLKEIGSSAFRDCSSLRQISLPQSTAVNQRAFKNSPTSITRFEPRLYINVDEIIENDIYA